MARKWLASLCIRYVSRELDRDLHSRYRRLALPLTLLLKPFGDGCYYRLGLDSFEVGGSGVRGLRRSYVGTTIVLRLLISHFHRTIAGADGIWLCGSEMYVS